MRDDSDRREGSALSEGLGPDAWRSAALVAGEHMVDVGPPGYYEWNARQWWQWFSALPQHKPPTLQQWCTDIYQSWPEDVRRRLSLHDLKRMWDAQYGPTPGA